MAGELQTSITDVPGVLVGHAEHPSGATGVTVVLLPAGAVGGVDVRGGGPGTHETDALSPTTLVPTVDAICLTGGSAYGLASAAGVMRFCEENGRGYRVGGGSDGGGSDGGVVPIVPAAAIFDLGRGGDFTARPGPDEGYRAASAAGPTVVSGSVGAGAGAVCGGATPGARIRGGVGTASITLPGGVVVGALVVVNAVGSPVAADGSLLAHAHLPTDQRPAPPTPAVISPAPQEVRGMRGFHTTLAVVVTSAALGPTAVHRMAVTGHDGLARGLRPVHTMLDGDTVFAAATGRDDAATAAPAGTPPDRAALAGTVTVQAAAADAITQAIADAVLSAGPEHPSDADPVGVPAYRALYPDDSDDPNDSDDPDEPVS